MKTVPGTSSDLFERILMLKHSIVFSDVATEDLRVVANELTDENYLAGERVFDINDHGDHMYFIEEGRIGISINERPEIKEFVAILGQRDCFGEMGLLDDLPRSATAHVLEDAQLLVLEKSRLRALIASYPELSLGIIRSMSLRLREANVKIQSAK